MARERDSEFPGPHIDDYEGPSVILTDPGTELFESRQGGKDRIQLSAGAGSNPTRVKIIGVSVIVSQPGLDDYTISATKQVGSEYYCDITFKKSGEAKLVGTIKWQSNSGYSVQTEKSDPITVRVAPAERKPIQVWVNSEICPLVGMGPSPKIKLPTGPGQPIPIKIKALHAKSVQVQCLIDNNPLLDIEHLFGRRGIWEDRNGKFILPESAAPKELRLIIRDTDYFNEEKESEARFTTDDYTWPTISITEPKEDQELYKQDVTILGRVDDVQSGYKKGTLKCWLNGKEQDKELNPSIEPYDDTGNFKFVLSADLGPNRVAMTAEDNSGNTAPEVTREFTVATQYKPKTIDELLSRRSYLADLLRFVSSHILDKDGKGISSKLLSQRFMPDAVENGGDFFGVLSEPGSDVGDRIINELLPVVFLLRNRPKSESAIKAYVRAAYEALLIAHGTSYEELRVLPASGTPARRAIAERLGLATPNAADDSLDRLLAPPFEPVREFEIWLNGTFGIPLTHELLPATASGSWRGSLLEARQDYLARQWQAEDIADSPKVRPLLDPDLVDPSDLNPKHPEAIGHFSDRKKTLEDRWDQLRIAVDVNAALTQVYSAAELESLENIDHLEKTGEPIANRLPPLGLSMPGFRRIRFYQLLNKTLSESERERDDLAHLLTQAWKLKELYPNWVKQERDFVSPLWPNSKNAGAFVTGNHKRDFLPWRGDATERSHLEKLVAVRIQAFAALVSAHEQAVLDAQRTALPLYRDKLFANPSSMAKEMDDLTELMLVDVASTGAMTRSLIDQAILMLQSLINGIRLGRFEAGHPAAGWTLRTEWGEEPKQDTDHASFDEEWAWMGSYSSWRSAKTNYLYPENALFPDLRTTNSTPEFKTFLEKLRGLAPSKLTDSWIEGETNGVANTAGVVAAEKDFFVPVAVAVMLERSGLYSLALDWYRKVFDTRELPNKRAKVELLTKEINDPPKIHYNDRWSLNLDPHTIAHEAKTNSYTRFILARITRCMAALADAEFARGTDESRAKALDLYLETKQILGFEELKTFPDPNLPNPIIIALSEHVTMALRKLRRGLTYSGTPVLLDRTGGASGISTVTRPTPYRFRVLVERAKQLLALSQSLEAQYLSALEKRDVEEEKYLRETDSKQVALEVVNLRSLQKEEALDGTKLAKAQKNRSDFQKTHYENLIAAGPNQFERGQITAIKQARNAKYGSTVIDTALSFASHAELIGRAGLIGGIALSLGLLGRGATQATEINRETQANLRGLFASQERRQQEWELQRDLANEDSLIAQRQIDLATYREEIADKEYSIAVIQCDQAQAMLTFLNNKFTSVEFYDWMKGVLADVYSFMLRVATTVARQAEGQLAFERQQPLANLIKQDYWTFVSQPAAGSSSAPDRRGITASARLLQDLTSLDQYAFDSEKRLLNLSQTFSLANLFPVEFEEFRRTGLLDFATTMRMFDEGFPGHYMRLIKKVRISVVALIPPNQGIRATLSTSGLSRVVTGDPSFPTVVIRQEPQSVALTSPTASTGIFELDMQSDLLYPFEGMGVDTNWNFELPPAANPLDFNSLFDVMMSIDYSALNSPDLREQVIKRLPRRWSGVLSFSVRRDLPDVWYDLANSTENKALVNLTLDSRNFPPGISDRTVDEIGVFVRLKDDSEPEARVRARFQPMKSDAWTDGDQAPLVRGIASSRQSGAASWSGLRGTAGANAKWQFELTDQRADSSILNALKTEGVDDILVVFTVAGLKPAWRS